MTPENKKWTAIDAELPQLRPFVTESNRIEGIVRPVKYSELAAHAKILSQPALRLKDIEDFVFTICQRKLRDRFGMDVYIGNHTPLPGCPRVRELAQAIVDRANDGGDPYRIHLQYETLHCMSDGNGRSGRALWMWCMRKTGQDPFRLPFLHEWYYQSLDESRR